MKTHEKEALLAQGLQQLQLEPLQQLIEKLLAYLELLLKWNRVYNLTAIREPEQILTHHLLDSLAMLSVAETYLAKSKGPILDVGTGAGLPGIPLSLVLPEQRFVLLDSNGKKTRFLNQAKATLALENIVVVNSRVESWQPEQPMACVMSRAFASLTDFVTNTEHFLAEDGHWLAMKGKYPQAEIDALPEHIKLESVAAIPVPFVDADRHLVILQPQSRSARS